MSKRSLNQQGIAHIAIVFVIVFFAVAGFAGYKILSGNKSSEGSSASTSGKIQNEDDLKATETQLKDAEEDVNTATDSSSLSEDVEAMR